MRLPTFAHHAPKAFKELVKIKSDFKRSALIKAGDPIVFRGAKVRGEALYTGDSQAHRSIVGKIPPKSYRQKVIKEYY
jgi:hypothetical protein